MARKSQEIKVVVHKPADIAEVFMDKQIEEFWVGKAGSKIRGAKLLEDEKKEFVRLLTEYLKENII